ncbi:MAG: Acetyltransferase domain [Candidatus Saccharibacteria bacterium]|jgi:predicted N-acetyltransferase YhbS|nr:Acetyltransferase domain [Candidatus Saccharibacteria bacterium]
MTNIRITEASVLSLPALNRLFVNAVHNHFQYFPEHVRNRVIKDHSLVRLSLAKVDPRRVLLVAKQDQRIIGYAIGAKPAIGPAQVYWLYVEPDHRGANIGLSLLSRMLKVLGSKGASEIAIATHDHRRYYERQGFKWVRNTMVYGVKMDILTFKVKA